MQVSKHRPVSHIAPIHKRLVLPLRSVLGTSCMGTPQPFFASVIRDDRRELDILNHKNDTVITTTVHCTASISGTTFHW